LVEVFPALPEIPTTGPWNARRILWAADDELRERNARHG
jgi:hypothetical protein